MVIKHKYFDSENQEFVFPAQASISLTLCDGERSHDSSVNDVDYRVSVDTVAIIT